MKKSISKPIEIINSIIERLETNFPDIFIKINDLEKSLHLSSPKHIPSIEDVKDVLLTTPNGKRIMDDINLASESECLLAVYNWIKTKVIYNVSPKNNSTHNTIDKTILVDMMMYDGYYINYSIKGLNEYIGAFVTFTKEKIDLSLRPYYLISYVYFDRKNSIYALGPVLISIKDNLSISEAFRNAMEDIESYNETFLAVMNPVNKEIINIIYTIHQLYNIKRIKHKSSSIARKVSEINCTVNKDKGYLLSYIPKYKYVNTNKTTGTGSPKAPHPVRSHIRRLRQYDDDGNFTGYREIKVSSYHTGREINKPTIKILSKD